METYFITGNKNKFAEVQSIIPKIEQLDIDLPEIQDIDAKNIIKAKLLEAFTYKEGSFIVEDTSLYLDCLNGLPGPLIKWFLATVGNDGIYNIAKKLGNSSAQAKTIIGYAKNKNKIEFFCLWGKAWVQYFVEFSRLHTLAVYHLLKRLIRKRHLFFHNQQLVRY